VVLTSYLVDPDNFNFFTCLRAMLRGFLGGTCKLASKLDGFSMTEMCDIQARLNLVFNDNGIITIANFVELLPLGFHLPLCLSLKSRSGAGDVLLHIVLQHQASISTTTQDD
jgi:hypothetical protein